MDRLDAQILGALTQDRQASPAQSRVRLPIRRIAVKLRVDEDTVRKRINKMTKSGFLKGWALFPNPNEFGIKGAELWMDVDSSSKKKTISSLLKIPGVATVVDLLGDSMIVVLFYSRSTSNQKLLREIEVATDFKNSDLLEMVFPKCEVSFSELDLKVCKLLQTDPLLSYKAIAERLAVSERTVRRRMKRMIQGNALFLQPSMDARALNGLVWTNLLVFYDSPSAKAAVDKDVMSIVGDSLVRAELNNQRYGFYTLFLPNVAVAQEIFENVKGRGVRRARMGFVQGFIDSYEAFKDFIPKS